MPRFMTISPTHIPGKKEYAWNQFRLGKYISIGGLGEYDLSGKSVDEVISLIRKQRYENEASAIDTFTKFLTLETGDHVAVNNTNDGLFGIGAISSGYHYRKHGHDIGTDDREDFYSHFREVDWKYTNYVKRRDIISQGETGWKPFGTVGRLEENLPPYIQRLLGIMPTTTKKPTKTAVPDYLKSVVNAIEHLKSDPNHQERAHESLVEDLFCSLGYEKHRDIRFRQGRVDISLWEGDKVLAIVEVKKDWNLSLYNSTDAVQQAYNYALDRGARWVILTNGDYYAIFDRLKGLSSDSNLVGEFRLTAPSEDDVAFIERISRTNLTKPNLEEIFRHLSESFR